MSLHVGLNLTGRTTCTGGVVAVLLLFLVS